MMRVTFSRAAMTCSWIATRSGDACHCWLSGELSPGASCTGGMGGGCKPMASTRRHRGTSALLATTRCVTSLSSAALRSCTHTITSLRPCCYVPSGVHSIICAGICCQALSTLSSAIIIAAFAKRPELAGSAHCEQVKGNHMGLGKMSSMRCCSQGECCAAHRGGLPYGDVKNFIQQALMLMLVKAGHAGSECVQDTGQILDLLLIL